MKNAHFIYLASASPRRQELLSQLGVEFKLLLADEHEDTETLELALRNESPTAYVQRVTQLKLQAAHTRLKQRGLPVAPVLCADTTVALGKTIYGKPQNAAHARRMLSELSGQTHRVLTAVAVAFSGGKVRAALSVSRVSFMALSAQQIKRYVDTQEPFGKAGAYAIQGTASAFISHMSGSYSGIMGLPLYDTARLLESLQP
jgi:septum formation protein